MSAWGKAWGLVWGISWGLVVAVDVPTEFTDFPQPYGTARQASVLHRADAHVVATSSKIKVLLSDPAVFAKVRLLADTDTVIVGGGSVVAKAGFKTLLVPVSSKTKTGTILASGRHDLSDEELITMFLELID